MEFPPKYRHSYKIDSRMMAACFSCRYMNHYFDKIVCMKYLVQVNLFGVCESWVDDPRDLADRHLSEHEKELLRFREPLPVCDIEGNTWPI
jgi:hypothetical protein